MCTPAVAQSLQRLTVTQLTLSADAVSPKVEVPFDLIVTAHVRERVSELRNLDLPILAEVELLGDEHSVVSNASGTTYTERVRVVAHHSGVITIEPATLDAIDPRDGKAKRYSSNSLSLSVGGGVIGVTQTYDGRAIIFTVLRWLLILARGGHSCTAARETPASGTRDRAAIGSAAGFYPAARLDARAAIPRCSYRS